MCFILQNTSHTNLGFLRWVLGSLLSSPRKIENSLKQTQWVQSHEEQANFEGLEASTLRKVIRFPEKREKSWVYHLNNFASTKETKSSLPPIKNQNAGVIESHKCSAANNSLLATTPQDIAWLDTMESWSFGHFGWNDRYLSSILTRNGDRSRFVALNRIIWQSL